METSISPPVSDNQQDPPPCRSTFSHNLGGSGTTIRHMGGAPYPPPPGQIVVSRLTQQSSNPLLTGDGDTDQSDWVMGVNQPEQRAWSSLQNTFSHKQHGLSPWTPLHLSASKTPLTGPQNTLKSVRSFFRPRNFKCSRTLPNSPNIFTPTYLGYLPYF